MKKIHLVWGCWTSSLHPRLECQRSETQGSGSNLPQLFPKVPLNAFPFGVTVPREMGRAQCKAFLFSTLWFSGKHFLFLWKPPWTCCPAANGESQRSFYCKILIILKIVWFLQTPSSWQPHCIHFPCSKVRLRRRRSYKGQWDQTWKTYSRH